MSEVLENVWMLLPGRRVARGNLVIDGSKIAAIEEEDGRCEDDSRAERVEQGDSCHVSTRSTRLNLPTIANSPRRLVMPGLVNCHGHTAMTLLRGVGGGLPLQRWLEEAIFPVEARMTPEDIAAGMAWGAMEMLAGGTTCVADMYDFPEAGAAALAASGMKGNLCRVGLAFPNGEPRGRLAECVAFARGEAGEDDRINRIGKDLQDFSREERGELEGALHVSSRSTRLNPVDPVFSAHCIRRDLCIHSEYLTDERFCRELAAANRELRRPVHFHVSETHKEHEDCRARHGLTPVAYLARTGLLDHGGYAAHGVWCTDDDFRIMAAHGVTLVHNPTSNLKLGSGLARVADARALGVNVALGTDGCASNDNLDLFEEMHLASLLAKGRAHDPTALSPWEVIEMATINGARALGRGDETGELAVGKAADLCVVDLDRPHLTPCLDLPNLVVHAMHASDVVATYVNGVKVYDRGKWPLLDTDAVRAEFDAAVRRLHAVS